MTQQVIKCPLCEWEYTVPPLDPRINAGTLASVFGLGVMANIAANNQAQETEQQLAKHLESHTTLQWLRKVTSQQREIEGFKRELAVVCDLGRNLMNQRSGKETKHGE